MKAKLHARFGVWVALSVIGFGRLVFAQLPGAAPGPSAEEARARSDESPSASGLDRQQLQRVQELEAARRSTRANALEDEKGWEESRAQRASVHRQQLAALWGSVVGTIDGQARLRMNADRMARLNRMLDLAEQEKNAALSARIQADLARELARHVQAMQTVQAEAGMR
ncbi:MAG TPA: hypothetical protein VER12_13580 [Polyangiaceae bacterium]|nr:hypothetical protein [Polyangiaceae bacterium]